MKQQIIGRYSDSLIFECELPAKFDNSSAGVRLDEAIKLAVKANTNLADADLTSANLAGADLTGANLADAYLADAYLTGAYLTGANLARADLTGADLTGANLTGADLSDAILTNVIMNNVCLTNAKLIGTKLIGAKWNNITISKNPVQVFGHMHQVTIIDDYIQIGCKLHHKDEWEAFSDDTYKVGKDEKVISFWKEHKDIVLQLANLEGI